MNNNLTAPNTITVTLSGTLLVVFLQAGTPQVMQTIMLAAIGASVSFLVSAFCRFVWRLANQTGIPQILKPFFMKRRTTHLSRAGNKLYAVRDKAGRFKNIQLYRRAQQTDLRKTHTSNDRKT